MATAATAPAHSKCRKVKYKILVNNHARSHFGAAAKGGKAMERVRQKWTDPRRGDIVRELYKVSKRKRSTDSQN